MSESKKAVIVCTKHRGVFFGFTEDETGESIKLESSRMAIYWATKKGVQELADIGPNSSSKIGSKCDALIHGVTAVFYVSEEATKKWMDV